MPAISGLMMFQANVTGLSAGDVHLMMIFMGIIALALALQGVAVLVGVGFAAKMLKKIEGLSDHFEQKTTPILVKSNALLEDLGPKIRAISTNVEEISYSVREKVDEVGEAVSEVKRTVEDINRTVQDANVRTRVQVARADDMVTEAMTTAHEVSMVVQDGIRTPVRQIAGIIAGVKAGLETLLARSPFGRGGPFEIE
jgi:methyl-accepting chemotaxis protein